MNGTYKEILKSGGEFTVNKDSWLINYYFPGIDFRYKGELFDVLDSEIDLYIDALQENFKTYQKLLSIIPQDGEYTTLGKLNMQIRIARFHGGVCLYKYHMPIKTLSELNDIINDYNYCKNKAKIIMDMISKLDK